MLRRVPPPSDAAVARVEERIRHRVATLMERRGSGPQTDPDEVDALRHDEPFLAELYCASVSGRAATGRRAGMRILAAINAPDAIQKILACLGLPTRAPPIAPNLSDTDTSYTW